MICTQQSRFLKHIMVICNFFCGISLKLGFYIQDYDKGYPSPFKDIALWIGIIQLLNRDSGQQRYMSLRKDSVHNNFNKCLNVVILSIYIETSSYSSNRDVCSKFAVRSPLLIIRSVFILPLFPFSMSFA